MSDIEEYLKSKKILIVDPSTATRSSVVKALEDLGAIKTQINSVKTYEEAVYDLKTRCPEIIISEYQIELKFGLDLIKVQSEYIASPLSKLFMLVTNTSDEAVVAEAAEEDVDAFVLKPFSYMNLVDNLKAAIAQKINPTNYQVTIQTGKVKLLEKEYGIACEKFTEAKTLEAEPTLACYYLGNTFEVTKTIEIAIDEYKRGLSFNPVHYKCLVGEFEALDKLKKRDEAYTVIQTLVQHFPVSPQRLGRIFTLAVYTQNFTDVDKYYEFFTAMEHRSGSLSKVVFGGLLICGKYFLEKKQPEEAEKIFTKLATSSGRSEQILSKIIDACVARKEYALADNFLRMYSIDDRKTLEYRRLDFFISEKLLDAPMPIIEKGMSIINDDIDDPAVYELVAKLLLKVRKTQTAEEVIYKAARKFPDKKDKFLVLLKEAA